MASDPVHVGSMLQLQLIQFEMQRELGRRAWGALRTSVGATHVSKSHKSRHWGCERISWIGVSRKTLHMIPVTDLDMPAKSAQSQYIPMVLKTPCVELFGVRDTWTRPQL